MVGEDERIGWFLGWAGVLPTGFVLGGVNGRLVMGLGSRQSAAGVVNTEKRLGRGMRSRHKQSSILSNRILIRNSIDLLIPFAHALSVPRKFYT